MSLQSMGALHFSHESNSMSGLLCATQQGSPMGHVRGYTSFSKLGDPARLRPVSLLESPHGPAASRRMQAVESKINEAKQTKGTSWSQTERGCPSVSHCEATDWQMQ